MRTSKGVEEMGRKITKGEANITGNWRRWGGKERRERRKGEEKVKIIGEENTKKGRKRGERKKTERKRAKGEGGKK